MTAEQVRAVAAWCRDKGCTQMAQRLEMLARVYLSGDRPAATEGNNGH